MKYHSTAYQGKDHHGVADTYVEARSEELAKEIGRVVMRPRVRGRFWVSADRYYPEFDRAFRYTGFIRKVEEVA